MTGYLAQLFTTARAWTGFDHHRSFPGLVVVGLVVALASLVPRAAEAGEAGKASSPAAVNSSAQRFTVDARLGPAFLLRSQSHAVRYLLKPDLRLGARIGWKERWEFGAAVNALLDGSEHYRVLGLMGQVRFAAVQLSLFSLGLSGAFGAGYDADILHSSLQADGRVAPYYVVGLDGRWRIGRFLLGVEGAYQNAGVIQAGLLVGVHLAE